LIHEGRTEKVAERLTVADLAASLMEVLKRAHGGEEVAIERDGEVIATIVPPKWQPKLTLRELAAELAKLPPLDDDFAADIEAGRRSLLRSEPPEWPD
jgi:antitoxin (DNA-binding transcriptional repressor) of toxin-antitoxin stability system